MRFHFIRQHRHQFSIKRMAGLPSVSRSGYFTWLASDAQPLNKRALARDQRDLAIKQAFEDSKQRNGARRLRVDLAEASGCVHDVKTIRDGMKRQGLVAKAVRKFKFKVTTDSQHALPISPNLLKREFNAQAPNQRAADITYLYTSKGWLYLAVMIDLYSRSVIAWSMSVRMTASLVCDALMMVLWRRELPEGTLIHGDRGSQYCSRAYRGVISAHKLRQSMSRQGDCWESLPHDTQGATRGTLSALGIMLVWRASSTC